jgi:ATP/maltotriose-dependent transcriptional regulator MalT
LIVSLAAVADEATPEARRARFHALAFAPPAESPNRSSEEWDRLTARAATVLSLRTAGRLYLSHSVYLQFLWRHEEAIPLAETAIALARRAPDAIVLLRSLHFYAEASWAVGHIPEAIAALKETRDTGHAINDVEGVLHGASNLSGIYRMQGDFIQASEQAAIAMTAAVRYGVPEFAIVSPADRGLLAYFTGDWDEARRYLARAEEIARSFGYCTSNMIVGIEGIVALATDREKDQKDQTRARMERVAEQAEQEHDVTLLRMVQAGLAEKELVAGGAEAARARLRHMAELPGAESTESLPLTPLLAWAEAETGDLERADALLVDSAARATTMEHQLALVDTYRVRALLETQRGRWQEAVEAVEQSLALARPMPYPYAVAKALHAYGRLEAARVTEALARLG